MKPIGFNGKFCNYSAIVFTEQDMMATINQNYYTFQSSSLCRGGGEARRQKINGLIWLLPYLRRWELVAYRIAYLIEPPRLNIPKGNWICRMITDSFSSISLRLYGASPYGGHKTPVERRANIGTTFSRRLMYDGISPGYHPLSVDKFLLLFANEKHQQGMIHQTNSTSIGLICSDLRACMLIRWFVWIDYVWWLRRPTWWKMDNTPPPPPPRYILADSQNIVNTTNNTCIL